jgi:hypothetical protein
MRTFTELNVPRRIAWRVMMPNQVSINRPSAPGCHLVASVAVR